jgi:nucleoside-diphosphate-sugar epimerase
MPAETQLCAVTGANGFVGACLTRRLQTEGWRVIPWTRRSEPGTDAVPFRLGQDVDPALLKGVRALVHCAYDFGPLRWKDITAVNVIGSQKLLDAARKAGVESIVVISSLSAFAGCRSLYGKAKLQIEAHALAADAFVIRPGLVYGNASGGMFGRLAKQVRSSRVIPILWGGSQVQYLLHEEDLGTLLQGALAGRVPPGTGPISAAHAQGWALKDILARIASALGKRPAFVPVPWQLLWVALKSLELARLPPGFRSDSLISIIYQDPHPAFELLNSLGFKCRPFQMSLEMLGGAPGSMSTPPPM